MKVKLFFMIFFYSTALIYSANKAVDISATIRDHVRSELDNSLLPEGELSNIVAEYISTDPKTIAEGRKYILESAKKELYEAHLLEQQKQYIKLREIESRAIEKLNSLSATDPGHPGFSQYEFMETLDAQLTLVNYHCIKNSITNEERWPCLSAYRRLLLKTPPAWSSVYGYIENIISKIEKGMENGGDEFSEKSKDKGEYPETIKTCCIVQ